VDVVLTLAGIALIALALRDIFETLFHPLGRGVIARHIVLGVWVAARRLTARASSALVLAGPLAYVIVIACWAGMLVVGWALIFLPHLPDGYVFDPGLIAADHDGFEDALYISLVNISSLGYGDISPQSALLRILGPTETIFGLALLTASISWLISIYNALSRRNTFAHEVHLTREAESELPSCSPSCAAWSRRPARRRARARCACAPRCCGWRSMTTPRRCARDSSSQATAPTRRSRSSTACAGRRPPRVHPGALSFGWTLNPDSTRTRFREVQAGRRCGATERGESRRSK
jgi:hypothetical protein